MTYSNEDVLKDEGGGVLKAQLYLGAHSYVKIIGKSKKIKFAWGLFVASAKLKHTTLRRYPP